MAEAKKSTRAPKVARPVAAIEPATPTEKHEGAVSLGGTGGVLIDEKGIAVIRPAKTKHGPRKDWREFEFAQLAIQALYGATPRKILNHATNAGRQRLDMQNSEWLHQVTYSL